MHLFDPSEFPGAKFLQETLSICHWFRHLCPPQPPQVFLDIRQVLLHQPHLMIVSIKEEGNRPPTDIINLKLKKSKFYLCLVSS